MKKTNQLISDLNLELHDLNVKLGKLNHALANPGEFGISDQQLRLMTDQANAMQKYSNVLLFRINDLKESIDRFFNK